MTVQVNDGGSWSHATPYVNDAGTWKAVAEVWVNDNGTWKSAFAAVSFNPPPGSYDASGSTSTSFAVTFPTAVVWTYTKSANIGASLTSGSSATGISFTLTTTGAFKTGSVTLQSGSSIWNLTLTVEGTA